MVGYDRSILTLYATALYVYSWAYIIIVALLGGGAGFVSGLVLQSLRPQAEQGILPLYLGGVFLIVGAAIGWVLSFMKKLTAQKLLLDVEVEKHLSALVASSGLSSQAPNDAQGNKAA